MNVLQRLFNFHFNFCLLILFLVENLISTNKQVIIIFLNKCKQIRWRNKKHTNYYVKPNPLTYGFQSLQGHHGSFHRVVFYLKFSKIFLLQVLKRTQTKTSNVMLALLSIFFIWLLQLHCSPIVTLTSFLAVVP